MRRLTIFPCLLCAILNKTVARSDVTRNLKRESSEVK